MGFISDVIQVLKLRCPGERITSPPLKRLKLLLLLLFVICFSDPSLRDYWTYQGSLTAPPCCQGVTWVIFRYPLMISHTQVNIRQVWPPSWSQRIFVWREAARGRLGEWERERWRERERQRQRDRDRETDRECESERGERERELGVRRNIITMGGAVTPTMLSP